MLDASFEPGRRDMRRMRSRARSGLEKEVVLSRISSGLGYHDSSPCNPLVDALSEDNAGGVSPSGVGCPNETVEVAPELVGPVVLDPCVLVSPDPPDPLELDPELFSV